jgi:hypothetical protein
LYQDQPVDDDLALSIQETKPTAAPVVEQNNILIISENHPLLQLLRQYPDPEREVNQPERIRLHTAEEIRREHKAGGYDHGSIYHARNIFEIEQQLHH